MRNEFVYSCSINCAMGLNKLLERLFCLLFILEAFSLHKAVDMLEEVSGSWLARGQVNMADEEKLCSPICSAFEASVVWCAVMHCHGEELGPFCSLVPAESIVVFGAFHHLLGIFLRCNGFAGIHKAVVDQSSSRPPNTDHDLFLVQVCLWEAFWSFFSVQPLSWPSLVDHISSTVDHIKSTFCHRSLSNQEMVHCCRIRGDGTTKWWLLFLIAVSSWGTHLLSFFTFPVYFKYEITVEWLMLSSWATSSVVVRESASVMLSIDHCQLLMASHCTFHFQGSHLLFKTFWTITTLYVR